MTLIDKNESGWLLTRVWLNALEETARDFHGTRPKEFCMRAYEHATDSWIKILEDEHGIYIPKADTLKKAVENYINAGIEAGLFHEASKFEIEDIPGEGIRITVFECPYQASCRDLLDSKRFSLKTMTCARIGCFRAAASFLTNLDSKYDLLEVKPGERCVGIIEPK